MTEPAPPAPQTVPADGTGPEGAGTSTPVGTAGEPGTGISGESGPVNTGEPPVQGSPERRGGHVRLADVTATLVNFAARHPEIDRVLMADLSGAVQALERLD
jgi:hypothetical protein